jgi:hypothetical protein
MAAKVLSVRVKITTLAGVYQLLAAAGLKTQGLAMGGALRTLINTIVDNAIEAGNIPELSELDAAEYIEELSVRDAGFTVAGLKATTDSLLGRGPNRDASFVPLPDGDAPEDLAREEIRKQMAPIVDSVNSRIDDQRFYSIVGSEARIRPPGEEPESKLPDPLDNPNPPWAGAQKVPSTALLQARTGSKTINKFFKEQDQIGLMATRVVLASLPSDMLGSDSCERLLASVSAKFRAWAERHPDKLCPQSIKFE